MATFKMGPVEDFENFVNAVIDEKSFDKLAKYIDEAKADKSVEIVAGGNYDKSKGWFVEPTVIKVNDPYYVTMCEELFGPVLSVYVYEDKDFDASAGYCRQNIYLRSNRRYHFAGSLCYCQSHTTCCVTLPATFTSMISQLARL